MWSPLYIFGKDFMLKCGQCLFLEKTELECGHCLSLEKTLLFFEHSTQGNSDLTVSSPEKNHWPQIFKLTWQLWRCHIVPWIHYVHSFCWLRQEVSILQYNESLETNQLFTFSLDSTPQYNNSRSGLLLHQCKWKHLTQLDTNQWM